MADIFGVSFAPGRSRNGSPRRQEDTQRAIQVLNLRLPRFEGARGIAPLSLLSGAPSIFGLQPIGSAVMSLAKQLAAEPGQSPLPTTAGLAGAGPMPGLPTQRPAPQLPQQPLQPRTPFVAPRQRETASQVAAQAQPLATSAPLPRISFEDQRRQPPVGPSRPTQPRAQAPIDRTSPTRRDVPLQRQTQLPQTQPARVGQPSFNLDEILALLPRMIDPMGVFRR